MAEEHFDELREWSARKHDLLKNYLVGFVRILGSRNPVVFYIDGFAGPGMYDDGNKGSPTLAAELAQSLVGKDYSLRCINVELDTESFQNLENNTAAYGAVSTNLPGAFGDQVDQILTTIRQHPAIFFLDPFGLKGIEWSHLSKVAKRTSTTELLMRVNPIDLQRLAGFWDSADVGAAAKCQLLTDYFGFPNRDGWLEVWLKAGPEGLVNLYLDGLRQHFRFVYRYAIRSIEGDLKYYMVFATRHLKGALLMNDTVHHRGEDYRRDVEEYRRNQGFQLNMFEVLDPTPEQLKAERVSNLKRDLQRRFSGTRVPRSFMREALLDDNFGRYTGSHFTQALNDLTQEGGVTMSGNASSDETIVAFRTASP